MHALRPMLGLLAVAAAGIFAGPAASQTFDDVHRCDELAAHPDDPGRWAKGVYDEDIVPGPAIKFCADAAETYPDTPRFHFQHGRALWVGKRYEEAVQALLRAEEMEYGPAYAYLGDAYLHGLGGVEADEAFATQLYQMAAEAGFEPAEAVLAQLAELDKEKPATAESGTNLGTDTPAGTEKGSASNGQSGKGLFELVKNWEETRPQTNAGAFNPGLFSRGRRLRLVYEGDFQKLAQGDGYRLVVYFMKLNDYFAQEINWHSESCSAYFDPDLGPGVMSGIMDKLMGSEQQMMQSGVQIMRMLGDLAKNPGAFMGRAALIEAEQNAATKDGVTLARKYGCEHPVFERLYRNMAKFMRDGEPAEASGWPGVRLACLNHAVDKNGASPRQAKQHCGCIVQEIKDNNVPERVGEWLGANYHRKENFGALVSHYPSLRKELAECLL